MAAGLTKTIATLSRQGSFWKALEVYEALPAAGLVPDTPIANAALSASNRGTSRDHLIKTPRRRANSRTASDGDITGAHPHRCCADDAGPLAEAVPTSNSLGLPQSCGHGIRRLPASGLRVGVW